MIGDWNGKILPFCRIKAMGKAGNDEIQTLASLILKKNPQVLLGFGETEQAEYKRRTKNKLLKKQIGAEMS